MLARKGTRTHTSEQQRETVLLMLERVSETFERKIEKKRRDEHAASVPLMCANGGSRSSRKFAATSLGKPLRVFSFA